VISNSYCNLNKRFHVLTAVKISIVVFRVVKPCDLVAVVINASKERNGDNWKADDLKFK
jgi:hypothetical protein